jgi:hypothetical protein
MRNIIFLLGFVLTLSVISEAFSETEYPEIVFAEGNITSDKISLIPFTTWSRNKETIINEPPKSVIQFTSNQIDSKFFSSPHSFADRFWGITSNNYKGQAVFILLFEPYIHQSTPNNQSCLETWHYYLSVAQGPHEKRFAITKLLISRDGDILYGLNVSPYSWEDYDCPLEKRP